jgi:hypothetical protein
MGPCCATNNRRKISRRSGSHRILSGSRQRPIWLQLDVFGIRMMLTLPSLTIKKVSFDLSPQTSLLAQIHWTFSAWPCILAHTYSSEGLSQFSPRPSKDHQEA